MPKICYVPKRFSPGVLRIIDQAVAICDEWTALGYDLTLRQLYYQFVARDLLANKQSEYNRLGEIVNDARLAGLLDWDHITDRTRNLRTLSHWGTPADIIASAAASYRRDKWRRQPVCCEVWVEKEALVGIVGAACEPEDVPYFACKGYTSQSEMWGAAMRLRSRIARQQATTVFHLGDHDPSGMDMSRDIEDRLRLFLSTHGYHSGFRLHRIALNLDQIDAYQPPPNPAKITDARFAKYQEEYGDESWELDALPPDVLTGLITEAIASVRDAAKWDEEVQIEQDEREGIDHAAQNWDYVTESLDAMDGNGGS